MMEKHTPTPGPWRVLEWADEKKGFIAVVGPGEPAQHICDVFPFGKRAADQSLAEHTANARLIAAAPDMATEITRLRALNAEMLQALECFGEALNYVANMTWIGGDGEWRFKNGYDPQRILDAITAAEATAIIAAERGQ
jgi:hypothetical protein